MQMTISDVEKKAALKSVMKSLFVAFPSQDHNTDLKRVEKLDQWFEDLRDISMEKIEKAADEYRKTGKYFPKIREIRGLAGETSYKQQNITRSDYYRAYKSALEVSMPFPGEYPKWNYHHTKGLYDGEIKAINNVRECFPGTRQFPLFRSAFTRQGYQECGNIGEMRGIEAAQDWSGERTNIAALVTDTGRGMRV